MDGGNLRETNTGDVVSCLYDVRAWGPSFDVISTLIVTEACRKAWYPDSKGIELIILTGNPLRDPSKDFQGVEFNTGYSCTADFQRQRLHKVVLPQADLIPAVKSVTVYDTKLGQKPSLLGRHYIYPGEVDVDRMELEPMNVLNPKARLFLAAAALMDARLIENADVALSDARAYAKRLSGTEHPIVVTLRRNLFASDRSRDNASRYLEVAESLARHHPVLIVPDTSDVPAGIATHLPVAYEASMCIRLRAALYEVARANFCGNGGPAALLALNKKVVYYLADLATGEHFNQAFWERQWEMADEILEKSTLDPSGNARKRLKVIKNGPNHYAPDCQYQKCDYAELTSEKAENFLASLATLGR